MAKDAYYFPHDSNAKDDPKCTALIDELGLEGYGIYWMLIETLRDQQDYKYPLKLIPSLARKYNTTAKKIESTVKRYGLFIICDDCFFFSTSLTARMVKINEKRAKLSEAGKKGNEKRWENQQALISPPDRDDIATQSQVKESKVKESKEEEIKGFSPLLSEFGFISTAEAKTRYLERDDYRNSREAMMMTKTKTMESLIFWIDKFNLSVDLQAKKQNMEGWVSYFGNWMNMHFDPSLTQQNRNGAETAMEKRKRLLKEQQQRNAAG